MGSSREETPGFYLLQPEELLWNTAPAAESGHLSSISRISIVERENTLPQIILWLPHAQHSIMFPPINKIKVFLKINA